MIEYLCIFSAGGIILWHYLPDQDQQLQGNPVNKLIRNVILQDRNGATTYSDETYTSKWVRNNDRQFYYVCVYRKEYMLGYVDTLLSSVDKKFVSMYKESLGNLNSEFEFESTFKKLYSQAEADASKAKAAPKAVKRADRNIKAPSKKEETEPVVADSNATSPEQDKKKFLESRMKKGAKDNIQIGGKKKAAAKESPKKVKRAWNDKGDNNDSSYEDYSKEETQEEKDATFAAAVQRKREEYMPTGEEVFEDSDDELSEDDDETAETSATGGGLFGYLKAKLGKAPLTDEDLGPAMDVFAEQLTSKNVASDTANEVVAGVRRGLVGKTLGTFTGISATFKKSLADALERILTAKRSTDILRGVEQAKKRGEPYVIVVCGVNGVGKSTSISKLAHWLMANNAGKVMLTACDTFRSGAVEQLRVHTECLGVHLYNEGYGKDAAVVAANGIAYAKREKFDVVLVDTAGRMQNNGPLMAALAKLIDTNQPQLVLFVGEALVGSDGVDQVKMFNQALEDKSTAKVPRLLDGIILTKFDTIDDKVGAAISMAYTTGRPIFFIGTGQRYVDFKRLNVKRVVNSLMA